MQRQRGRWRSTLQVVAGMLWQLLELMQVSACCGRGVREPACMHIMQGPFVASGERGVSECTRITTRTCAQRAPRQATLE